MSIFAHKPQLGVNSIFDAAQKSVSSHQRLLKELAKLYRMDSSTFTIEFLQCLLVCLSQSGKLVTYESAIGFAAKYCLFHENALNDETFLPKVLKFIFAHHSCANPAVRFRSCDLIYQILNSKGEQAMIDDELFLEISETMLSRLQDKLPSVRAQAVLALQRLQDPFSPKCPIIKAFLFHMEHDPSADVRSKVIKSIAVSKNTLPAIFGRIYDVKLSVKKEAILALSKLKVHYLTIEWRQKILKMGHHSQEEIIKSCISKLILMWFGHCNENFLDLLKVIDVETLKNEIVDYVLFQLFKKQPITRLVDLIKPFQTQEKLIPISKLEPNVACLWLSIVSYYNKNFESGENKVNEDYSSEILPELTRFSKYMKAFSTNLSKNCKEKEFIMLQLVKIATTFSLSDEMGREQLKQLYRMLLTDDNVQVGLVPSIVHHLEEIVPSFEERSKMIAEIISDIREPLPDSDHVYDQCIFDEGAECNESKNQKENLEREVRREPDILIKCLTIVIEFMKGRDVTKLNGTLLILKDYFLLPCFKEENVQVVRLAQDTLCLMCLKNLKLAQDYFINYCIQVTDVSAGISAVNAIFDLLIVFGFDAFSSGSSVNNALNGQVSSKHIGALNDFEKDYTLTTPLMKYLVPLLVSFLYSNIPDMRAAVSQGLAKLCLAGIIKSPLILGHLVLIWFSPVTAKEPLVRQPLGSFFSLYAKKTSAGEIILNSVVPTLKTLDEMMDDDMLSEVNPLAVVKLLVSLLRYDCKQSKEGGSHHLKLAVILCENMLKTTSNTLITVFSKTLLMLSFCSEDENVASNLLNIIKKSIKKMGKYWEKRIVKTMEIFREKVKSLVDNASHPSQGLSTEDEVVSTQLNVNENYVKHKENMRDDDAEEIVTDLNNGDEINGIVSESDDNDSLSDDEANNDKLGSHSTNSPQSSSDEVQDDIPVLTNHVGPKSRSVKERKGRATKPCLSYLRSGRQK